MPTSNAFEEQARARAAAAAASVSGAFGGRLFGLPGTHLAHVSLPRRTGAPWHYWWQAHYLDCLLDAAERESANSSEHDDGACHRTHARRLLRTIRLRNGGRWRNSYYDDMAWLALAALRAADIAGTRPLSALNPVLASAHTPDLGGGLFWNTSRDFKNTPATAPAALYFARLGRREEAARLVDWLFARLQDPETGLLRDGIRTPGERLVTDLYTYNQGPVLGVLLALGGEQNLQRAGNLIDAVATHLVQPSGALRTHGGGDGGLFTGILARYLALAAVSPALPEASRTTAGTLITTTADALWEGRTEREVGSRRRTVVVFPSTPGVPAGIGTVELSTQLQSWMVLEAACRVPAVRPANAPGDG
ncbi:Predicted alpha-1,6-mannanase, GH76 family [Arthrobacter subterraneus]|uniref:Predicted alpha-1,6-mannanase, GH76 family n=1 Tax=Arthrobacter subterraneus TaxID=335973 RepID=A0A1G8KJV8_9MICC|nr:glycoside hydrolase family 76 protein [Arthrobacter subterraneus]SDI43679.1 Predicted alpha-1,6-mannanase, GH76 family [Arthrobacter subterraneus]